MTDQLELSDDEVEQIEEIELKPIVARETSQPVVVNNATSMLQAVGQMALNPAVDIEKVERLMALQEKLQAKENEDAFNRALAAAESKMEMVVKNKPNNQTGSNYADLGAIVEMAQPIYTSEGISLSFTTERSEDKTIVPVVCFVSAAGHTRRYEYDSPITDKGTGGKVMMTPQHARGSAISYGRRYLTCMIFNIPTGDDDDGNGYRSNIEYITDEQLANLHALMEEVGANKPAFLRVLKVEEFGQLPSNKLQGAITLLEGKRKNAS